MELGHHQSIARNEDEDSDGEDVGWVVLTVADELYGSGGPIPIPSREIVILPPDHYEERTG